MVQVQRQLVGSTQSNSLMKVGDVDTGSSGMSSEAAYSSAATALESTDRFVDRSPTTECRRGLYAPLEIDTLTQVDGRGSVTGPTARMSSRPRSVPGPWSLVPGSALDPGPTLVLGP